MRFARPFSLILTLSLLVPLLAQAVTFPDVPATHPFVQAIDGLVQMGVINGNPDGTFRPGDPVNRAAMLKMLYLASGKTPASTSVDCFPDVEEGSWYETYVCDAAAKGYVMGYAADNTFKPARPVTRAEALKMVIVVFGINVGEASVTGSATYTDAPVDAWFASYVNSALQAGIIPLSGREYATTLSPNEPIDRAEAAAFIWNGTQSSAVSSASNSTSFDAATTSSAGSAASQVSSRKKVDLDDTGASARVFSLNFPFDDIQRFEGKTSFSYRFHADTSFVADVTAKIRDGQGGLTCTLFRLDADGMSTEYYLGYTEGAGCYLRSALSAGDYQLQLQPTVAGTEYVVETAVGSGDGNDGFSQAANLPFRLTRVGVLEDNDLEDWFTFTLTSEQKMTLSLTSADKLRCIINPSSNVDLFGFEGPGCNAAYTYPSGTYYVGIGHAFPKAQRQLYTIELK